VARAYVNVVNSGVAGQYDIQYWFYYAFNGPTTIQFDGPVGKSTTNEAPPLGQHDGDWEHIVVRVADSGNIVSVFFAEHGSGQWCQPASASDANDGFHQENSTHVQVYVAKNTHASYPWPGNFAVPGSARDYKVISVTLRDLATFDKNKSKRWDTSNALETVNINALNLTSVQNPPQWVYYTGLWGPNESQGLSVGEATQVVLQIIVAAPWLAALLSVATVAGASGLAAVAVIATAILSIVDLKKEPGLSSPAWNQMPSAIIGGRIIICNWNCQQHQQRMVLTWDQNGGLILTDYRGMITPNQQWICWPNTDSDAPIGSFTLACGDASGRALTIPNDGQQITLGNSTNSRADKAYAWVLWPVSKPGDPQLWEIRGALRGNVMDASGRSCGSGTKVIYYGRNNGDNQRWVIAPVG
jgi:hypothetical protein